jgi:hypothetical protein
VPLGNEYFNELISGILCVVGAIQLVMTERLFGFYGLYFLVSLWESCLLFGQRLAKDYDGTRTIVICLFSGNRSILVELKSPLKNKTFILLYEPKHPSSP